MCFCDVTFKPEVHPWKIITDAENHPFAQEFDFPKFRFGFHVSFWECNQQSNAAPWDDVFPRDLLKALESKQ